MKQVEDWTCVDPHLFAGEPLLAMKAVTQQGIPLRTAIDLINERALALYEATPEAFSNPPPWRDAYT